MCCFLNSIEDEKLTSTHCASKVSFHDFDCGFHASSFDGLCEEVLSDMKAFCAHQSLQLHMSALTRALVGFPKSSSFPTG